jgi:hypothetical protein
MKKYFYLPSFLLLKLFRKSFIRKYNLNLKSYFKLINEQDKDLRLANNLVNLYMFGFLIIGIFFTLKYFLFK